jgi:phenylacetate-coenzyme A ligase PaaK-like adenylate-forming protein
MSLKNFIAEEITLRTSDIVTGQTIKKHLTFLKKSQYWSRQEIDDFQNKKLKLLLDYVYKNVPYYEDLFHTLKIKPIDIQNKNDLIKLPILTKAIIKQEGIERFTSKNYPVKKRINTSSSGSTGEPLFYINTKDAYSVNAAAKLRGWYWMGFRLGDRYLKLSQNPRRGLIKKLQDIFSNNLYLATNPLVEENFAYILNQIEEYKPKIIRCYPDPLLFLARYKKFHPEYKFKPKAIATTGNTLFPETRKEIGDAFGCKIFDSYSCEGNSTVFECPTNECYHSTEEYGISEVIDEKGNSITNGIGRLISTDLWNWAHPFIRYDTQDFIEVDSEPCSCERHHLKIKRILGRDNEILEMESGQKFIVHNFTGFFQTDIPELNRSIEHFQVAKQQEKVVFRLVVNNNYSNNVADYIKDYWKKEMQAKVEIEILKDIPLTKSGKRRFIINE